MNANDLWVFSVDAVEPLPHEMRADQLRSSGGGHVYGRVSRGASLDICRHHPEAAGWFLEHGPSVKLCISLPGALLQLFCHGLADRLVLPSHVKGSFAQVPAPFLSTKAGQQLRTWQETFQATQAQPQPVQQPLSTPFGANLNEQEHVS